MSALPPLLRPTHTSMSRSCAPRHAQITSKSGLSIAWNTALTDLKQGPDGVRATLSLPDGGVEAVTAGYVLGADGAHSAVRRLLGEPSDGDAYPLHFVVADLTAAGAAVEGELNFLPNPALSFLAFFPLPGPRQSRLATTLPPALDGLEEPTFDALRAPRRHPAPVRPRRAGRLVLHLPGLPPRRSSLPAGVVLPARGRRPRP